MSGVSQRRIARLLRTTRKTIAQKFLFLEAQARERNRHFRESLAAREVTFEDIQFDEMETFEWSKCLPVSIPLVVDPGARKILGFKVASMPAKGLLAQISRKRYGHREDGRPGAVEALFKEISPLVGRSVRVTSDENPKYPAWIRARFPEAHHITVKGRRGCVVGQGELKRGGFDPLFALNHTAAMIRANINRLFRRTWCTTKRRDRLAGHLELYMDYHNRVLT